MAGHAVDTLNDSHSAWYDAINWHGFLSQSYILTDENNFLGSSSDGSFKFNSAGLNASWKPNNSLQFSVQGLYKQIGNAEPKGTQLDFAIADWALADEFEYGAGVRVGRLKNPYGFFNETRDVAATRPSLLLAESIYIDYLQALFHSMDSVGVYLRGELDSGTLSLESNFGKPILTSDITYTLMGGNPLTGDIVSERASMSRLMFEDGGGLWRAALSYVWFYGDYRAGPSEPVGLVDGKLDVKQLMVSFEYNLGDWQFISEAQRRDVSIKDSFRFPVPFNVLDKSLGYYLQIGYRVSDELNTYVRRDEAFYDKDDKKGVNYQAFGRGNDHAAFAKDLTFGLSYTPSFEWNFGVEFHVVDGTYWLPNLENPDVAGQKQHWNMFLAQVAYRF
jgi:hypothetical protein